MQWNDTQLAQAMVTGCNLLGELPLTGVFEPVREDEPALTREQLWGQAPEIFEWFQAQPLDEHAEFLWQSCAKEAQNGWASDFLRKDQVDATFP